jgi:hypothetical protein
VAKSGGDFYLFTGLRATPLVNHDSTSATLLIRLRQPANQAAWTQFVRLYTPLLVYWARKARLAACHAYPIGPIQN